MTWPCQPAAGPPGSWDRRVTTTPVTVSRQIVGAQFTGPQPVALVTAGGEVTESCVGRTKIEKRPLLLVEAEGAGGVRASLILQNAETVRLVGEDGKPISVAALKEGDRVLGATAEAGRHFGVAVKEKILEK